ncbi:hypothetical protein CDAR_315281 [Caerostris darwini]|uniref:Uncharacterized protein n=1 Tax=Caerostris darwini TaxID=1538125 RepID=A0AAV4RIB9_9ARAC|nr:hypothetical protein CDAR_315281 [Caerostris darwini]
MMERTDCPSFQSQIAMDPTADLDSAACNSPEAMLTNPMLSDADHCTNITAARAQLKDKGEGCGLDPTNSSEPKHPD